jgi:DNA-binding NarL/FixJ family response regulator
MEATLNTCFIVDDHQVLADGIAAIIEKGGYKVCGKAIDGIAAVRNVAILKPDIILMDLDLPEMNGLEASRQILEKLPEAKILMLTMHLEKSVIEKAMKLGIKGYIPKNAPAEELLTGISAILSGKNHFSSDVTFSLAGMKSVVSTTNDELLELANSLSEREIAVLRLIADGKTNKEIAEELFLSTHTVDSHRKNIMQKTGCSNTASLIRFGLKSGIVD